MFELIVNGVAVSAAEDMRLIDFLRDELHLTGTKDGCSAGACGACTILVNGKKTKACIPKLSQSQGAHVVTIEGLTPRERDVYVYAFGATGAVQCGFCIPGMVMSAKALLDTKLEPSEQEIRTALIGNICRCTGYVKIVEGIQLAATLFQNDAPVPEHVYEGRIGEHIPRVDVEEKTLGTGLYADDVFVEGMLYAKAVRLTVPRAHINSINVEKALAHPDCVTVFTAEDVPYKKCGHIVPDWDVLIAEGSDTRYVGDSVALVVVQHKKHLNEVASLVEVDYTELKPLTNPFDAMKADAPKLHEKGNILTHEILNRGNVEEALANAAHVVTNDYYTPQTDHAFMEPECAVAIPQEGDGLLLYTGDQSVYDDLHEISRMLQIPEEKIQVHAMLVGGGFGGKEDMTVQHHAALAAYKLGKPVKVQFTRQESLDVHVKRHAMFMNVTTGCDAEGNLVGSKVVIVSDCGAYASLGGPVLQRACTHSGGPYHYDNFYAEGTCVYTNNVPGGAFRGFGVTQSCFAQEVNIDLLAEKVGMDPWEFRYKNAIRPGESLPNGQIAGPETGLVECLEAVKDNFYNNPYTGVAVCMKNSGIGVGLPDIGRVNVKIIDGKCHIRTSAACIGQGVGTVVLQMLCETTGLPAELFVVEAPDTNLTPNSGTTTASRQTLFAGEAARQAGLHLLEALQANNSTDEIVNSRQKYTAKDVAALEGVLIEGEYSGVTDPMGSPKEHPKSHIAYGYGACTTVLSENGKVELLDVAYDVGRVINPRACEGQIEGGTIMGMGYALTEDFKMDNGIVKSKYGTLGLLRANQCPPIRVSLIEKAVPSELAYGAKGIGEICSIPMAPSICNAYRRKDGINRFELPLKQTAYKK